MELDEKFEILKVAHNRGPASKLVAGYSIDQPKTGDKDSIYALQFAGWAMGRRKKISHIELYCNGDLLTKTAVEQNRPDVASILSSNDTAVHSGFAVWCGLLGIPEYARIRIVAVFEDENKIDLGCVDLRHRSPSLDVENKLQPIMITGLGRSGTTFLMKMLSQHPAIVAHTEYPLELRAGRYWMHMLKVLSDPALRSKQYLPGNFWHTKEYIGPNPYYLGVTVKDDLIKDWMSSHHIDKLGEFCVDSIESLYEHIGADQNKNKAIYYAEKHYPDHIPVMNWNLYHSAREIFLVRDFRDMICSMLASNKKRGTKDFGRANAETDAEFIEMVAEKNIAKLQDAWNSRANKAHLLYYEDLIGKPEYALNNLLNYIGIENSELIVKNILETSDAETESHHKTSETGKKSIGRWRRDLPKRLQRICNDAFGSALNTFGYEV